MLLIPQDAWILLSDDNDNPLKYANDDGYGYRLSITEKLESTMKLEQFFGAWDLAATYMSAILTPDRSEVIWVNDTKPLP